MEKNKKRFSRKVWLSFIIVGLLLPYIQGMVTGFKKVVVAQPKEEILFENDVGKVSAASEIADQEVTWTIYYEKKASDNSRKFFFHLKNEQGDIPLSSINSQEEFVNETVDNVMWMSQKNFANNETSSSFSVTTSVTFPLSLTIQVEENQETTASSSEVLKDASTFLLSEKESGPYELKAEIPTTESTTGTTESSTISSESSAESTTESSETITSESITTEKSNETENDSNSYSYTQPEVQDLRESGSLIISNQTQNKASDLEVTVDNAVTTQHTVEYDSSKLVDYQNIDDLRETIYSHYLKGSGKVNVEFNKRSVWPYTEEVFKDTVIKVNYPSVGFLNDKDGNQLELGAHLTVTNIIVPRSTSEVDEWGNKQDSWINSKEINLSPTIDFSTNLYSGIYMSGIYSVDIAFEFYDKATEKPINFDEYVSPFMTFKSLNGFGENGQSGEFIKKNSGETEGTVVEGSHVKLTQVKPNNQPPYYSPDHNDLKPIDNVYMSDGYYESIDFLGNPEANKLAVTFPLNGSENSYTMGTGGSGAYGGAWFGSWITFSSSALVPTEQITPIKTVEPVNQYQAGDTWDNPTGPDVGFNERFFNDLDRYNDGGGTWDLKTQYRIKGHDAENPNELLSGIPQKADRYVQTNQEYYYFINQPTINLASQGMVLPDDYVIEDSLPEGVTYEKFVAYDQGGSKLEGVTAVIDGQKLKFEFSEEAVRQINELAKIEENYGKDFSVQIRVKVNNTSTDNIPDLMENTATSTFSYNTENDLISYTETSNKVHTKIIKKTFDLTFFKVNSDHKEIVLPGAEFELTKEGDPNFKLSGTSDEDGKVVFEDLLPGVYFVSEVKAVLGYNNSGAKYQVTINSDGTIVWPEENDGNTFYFINDLKVFDLSIKKINGATETPLKDIVFHINKKSDPNFNEQITTDENGYTYIDKLAPDTYTIVETTPLGFETIDPIEFTINNDGSVTSDAAIEVTLSEDDLNWDSHNKLAITIKNYPKISLPSTGGQGINRNVLLGLVTIFVSGLIFLVIYLKNKEVA